MLTASHSLQAMQRSSPDGYRRSACSPRNRGEMGPFSNGYMIVYGARKNCSMTTYMPRAISVMRKNLPALSSEDSPSSHVVARPRRGVRCEGGCVACRVMAVVENADAAAGASRRAAGRAVCGRSAKAPRVRRAAMVGVAGGLMGAEGRRNDVAMEVAVRWTLAVVVDAVWALVGGGWWC